MSVAALAIGLTGISIPASAAITVTNADELEEALGQSGTDGEVVVGADITVTADQIEVDGAKTLDLNGWWINAKTIKVTSGSQLSINDGADGGGLEVSGAGDGSASLETTDAALHIHSGTVIATSNDYGAAIGGSAENDAGEIFILGGTVKATSTGTGVGQSSAIGGGRNGSAGTIRIEDGTVTASTNGPGAAIGGYGDQGEITIRGGIVEASTTGNGAAIGGSLRSDGPPISISGGEIEARATAKAAAIGGGSYASTSEKSEKGSQIDITGGTINAISTGDELDQYELAGAAIGGGATTSGGNITIAGGEITAGTNHRGAAIGGGAEGAAGNITIKRGSVFAETNRGGAAIGAGSQGEGGTIEIQGGDVTAYSNSPGAAIGGGGGSSDDSVIIIKGGEIAATTDSLGAAIGGGNGETSVITIAGGAVTAKSGMSNGAAIGGGTDASGLVDSPGGDITISGGVVEALSEGYAAAIGGGGADGTGGNITIKGGEVTAESTFFGAAIGGAYRGHGGHIAIEKGAIVAAKAANGSAVGAGIDGTGFESLSVAGELIIDSALVVPDAHTATVADTGIISGSGQLDGAGTIENHGVITLQESDVDDEMAILDHNYLVKFITADPSNDPEDVRVYATTFDAGARDLPQVPTDALQWSTAANGTGETFDRNFAISEDLTVYALYEPDAITLEPATATVDEGESLSFAVTGFFEDYELGDVTGDVTFTSDVATDVISGNQITFTTASTHVITATHDADDSLIATAVITVTPADTDSGDTNDNGIGDGDLDDGAGDGDIVDGGLGGPASVNGAKGNGGKGATSDPDIEAARPVELKPTMVG